MEFEDVFCANRGFCSGASLVVVSVRTGLSWHGRRLRRLLLSFSTYQPKMMMPNSVNNIFCNVRTLLLQSTRPNSDSQAFILFCAYDPYFEGYFAVVKPQDASVKCLSNQLAASNPNPLQLWRRSDGFCNIPYPALRQARQLHCSVCPDV